jgi:hypothetical protein
MKNLFFTASVLLGAVVTIQAVAENRHPLTNGVRVLDSHDNVLGILVGLADTYQDGAMAANGVVVYKNGYFISLEFSGKFPVASHGVSVLWTGTTCSGNGYLAPGVSANPNFTPAMGTKVVIYSGKTNSLYVPSGDGPSVAASLSPVVQSIETALFGNGSSACGSYPANRYMGWLLSTFDAPTELGWNVSGDPLGVAGPIKFQEY